jgi:two-component system cell cycle response regulator CpdR
MECWSLFPIPYSLFPIRYSLFATRYSLFATRYSLLAIRYSLLENPMARILIAEDEEAIRSLVARALALDGHQVMTANDGAQALDVLTRERGAFELLLTDIRMPVMDGIALALAAARDHPRLAILLMTGFADQRERACGLDALIHDVVAKPFSLAVIRGAVNEALAGTRPVH